MESPEGCLIRGTSLYCGINSTIIDIKACVLGYTYFLTLASIDILVVVLVLVVDLVVVLVLVLDLVVVLLTLAYITMTMFVPSEES